MLRDHLARVTIRATYPDALGVAQPFKDGVVLLPSPLYRVTRKVDF